ncbi:MAG TPA: 50S ribosomal protein L7ae [Candidatus Woesearchaeota archaeon]|nr:50S ribosomal protein L7ae [Candidatus Woesearchaeota archaeon]
MAVPKGEIPKVVIDKALELIEIAKNTGKIKKGTNEATKAVERGKAKMIAVAGDVTPPEIVMHLPALCEEKNIPFVTVSTKQELGTAAGLEVPTSAIAVLDAGDAKSQLKDVIEGLRKVKG